jgi:hypothetical protein
MSAETNASSFKSILNANPAEYRHPLITTREAQIGQLLETGVREQEMAAEAKGYKKRYPNLFPQDFEQGLVLTPFDEFEGLHVGIPSEDQIEGWKRMREYNLTLANAPERIAAMRALEERGFQAPKKLHGIIDEILDRSIIPQLSDLGHNRDISDGLNNYVQVHRTDIFANGPFSFVGRKVRSFVGLGAMPDVNGSVLALETAAKMHALAEVPEVGIFSDPKVQARFAKEVLDRLTIDDPLLTGRSDEEKQFIVDHWRSCVVGVLEVGPNKALKRAQALLEVGVTSFRPYGHSVGKEIVATTKALRKELGDEGEIFSSQLTSVDNFKACEAVGADAGIVGVGSGGRCTTADLSGLIPSNAALAWRLRGEIGIPVIGEGGAVDEVPIAILAGMSGVNGSGSIGGGTFEAPGGMFFLTRDNQTFVKPYGGEASPRTKWLSGRTYPTGLPYFPEGEQSFKTLIPLEESMSQRFLYHWGRIILAAVMLGIDDGPSTISAMQNIDPSPLLEKSPTTHDLQRTH